MDHEDGLLNIHLVYQLRLGLNFYKQLRLSIQLLNGILLGDIFDDHDRDSLRQQVLRRRLQQQPFLLQRQRQQQQQHQVNIFD